MNIQLSLLLFVELNISLVTNAYIVVILIIKNEVLSLVNAMINKEFNIWLALTNKSFDYDNFVDSIKPVLRERIETNEANSFYEFEGFDDTMILFHYLFRDTHVNKMRGKSKSTIETYRKVIVQFVEDCHNYSFDIGIDITNPVTLKNGEVSLFKSLGKRHMQRYVDWLNTKSPYAMINGAYKPASLSQKVNILKGFFKKLYEWKYIDFPLHVGFQSTSLTEADRPNRDASAKHVKYLLQLFEETGNVPMFSIIHVLTTTGIRNAEFCKLKVGDVVFDSINDGYYINVIAKGNKLRKVPLREKTLNSINLFRYVRGLPSFIEAAKTDPNAPLFTTNRGKAYDPSYLSKYFKRQIEGLPKEKRDELRDIFSYNEREDPLDENSPIVQKEMTITPHMFRHAFAIISKQSNIELQIISQSLGHENLQTTKIYLEKVMALESHAINSWDDSIFGEYI